MDAAGKDSMIRHIMSGVNPQGCEVTSFKQPTTKEIAHDYLWRIHDRVPKRGMIGSSIGRIMKTYLLVESIRKLL